MTRILKKTATDPKKERVEPESSALERYQRELADNIVVLKRDVDRLQGEYEEKSRLQSHVALEAEQKHLARQSTLNKEINDLEEKLIVKRAEWKELNKPLFEREQGLNEREIALTAQESELAQREQAAFEAERTAETKLDAVRDMADELGSKRAVLLTREKSIELKENVLRERENQYLLKISAFNEEVAHVRNELHTQRTDIEVAALYIQGKEENLVKREEALLEEKLLIQSQRQALLAAEQHGKPQRANWHIA